MVDACTRPRRGAIVGVSIPTRERRVGGFPSGTYMCTGLLLCVHTETVNIHIPTDIAIPKHTSNCSGTENEQRGRGSAPPSLLPALAVAACVNSRAGGAREAERGQGRAVGARGRAAQRARPQPVPTCCCSYAHVCMP